MRQSDLTDFERGALVEALNHLLGNGCRLFRVSKCCSWNAQGQYGSAARELFGSQAEEIWNAQNGIALSVRRLGGEAVPDDSDGVVVERPQELKYLIDDARRLAVILVEGHRNTLLSLRAANDVAAELEKFEVSSVIGKRIEAHTRHLQQLSLFGGLDERIRN